MAFFRKRNKQNETPAQSILDLRRVSSEENNARDMQLAESLSGICAGEFPDNEHNTWNLVKTHHVVDRIYALVEPDPKDVGYDKFVLVLDYTRLGSSSTTLAIYCLEGDRYSLLATTPHCADPLPGVLIWE